jgi:L-ascorbate metabolism protein UlaG (beta-lactamase superfamily)
MNDEVMRAEGMRRERSVASPQWADGRFRNAASHPAPRPPLKLIGEFMFRRGRRIPAHPLPVMDPVDTWRRAHGDDLRVTWLGHSTALLEFGSRRVLTDPVFGERASPFRYAGPRRFHPVPAPLEALPPLDAVLLSHDHFDHLCAPTMRALAKSDVPIVTALGVGARLVALGVHPSRITELDWHESAEVGGLRFFATPAQHFSGRGLTDRNRTLWASWVLDSGRHRVFFSGDTGLTEAFREIGARHGPFDLVMLEIGAFHPAWGTVHLGPEHALTAFDMLGGGTLLPVHWSTFSLALHDWDEPAETLATLAGPRRVLTPRLGQVFIPDALDGLTPWWREVETERAPSSR